jgi:hypothetical protein
MASGLVYCDRVTSNLLMLGFDPDTAQRIHHRLHGGGVVVLAGGNAGHRWYALRAIVDDLQREGRKVTSIEHVRGVEVVLAGEASDPNLCAAAIDAARRGHLAIIGLDVADAAHAIRALETSGAGATSIRSVLRGVIGVRWLRRLCRSCAEPIGRMSRRERLLAFRYSIAPMLRAAGCARCCWTGFSGVIPLVHFDDDPYAATSDDATFDNAVELVRRGETTIDELARVVRRRISTNAPPLAVVDAPGIAR